MARAARDIRLENRTNRLKLEIEKRHYLQITEGVSLVYRRTSNNFGVWSVRIKTAAGKDRLVKIAPADDYQDADGDAVLSFTQAQEKARALFKESNAVGSTTGKIPTIEEIADHYLAWFKVNRKSYKATESTIRAHILPTLGKRKAIELTPLIIRQWLQRLATQPARKRSSRLDTTPKYQAAAETSDDKRARKSSANRIFTVLKAMLNKGFEDDLISDDKAWRKVKPFENADEPIIRFLDEAESIRLINACATDFRPMIKAALLTGCRYGELQQLQVKDVNPDAGLIYVSPDSKSGKGRHIPLSTEGLDFFKTAILGKKGADLVFTRADGDPWGKGHQTRPMQAACKHASIEPAVGFHELRHCYASSLAQRGVDLLTISKLLGHSDTRITSLHYAHLCDSTLKTAVENVPSYGHVPETKIKAIR